MTAQNKTDDLPDATMASAHLRERREPRYSIPFEIEVSGIDANGEVFHQRTVTKNVSEWGCGFDSTVELKTDNIVAIQLLGSKGNDKSQEHEPAFFQVMRVQREGDKWSVGAWKMADGSVWGTELERLLKPAESRLEARKEGQQADSAVLSEHRKR